MFTEKGSKVTNTLFVEHGKPLVFGNERTQGIVLDGLTPKVVSIGNEYSEHDLWIHDEHDLHKAQILARLLTILLIMMRCHGLWCILCHPTTLL